MTYSNRGGALVPSPGGRIDPRRVQECAVQVITPHDRAQYEPQVLALCQRQQYGQLARLLDQYVNDVRAEYLSLSAQQQADHRATFDQVNGLWYSQFKPQLSQLSQAIAANTDAAQQNTQALDLSSRATAGNTIATRQATNEMAALRQSVEGLAIVQQDLAATMQRQQQQPRSLPVHMPQSTTHHHIHSASATDHFIAAVVALFLLTAFGGWGFSTIRTIRMPDVTVPAAPAPQIPVPQQGI